MAIALRNLTAFSSPDAGTPGFFTIPPTAAGSTLIIALADIFPALTITSLTDNQGTLYLDGPNTYSWPPGVADTTDIRYAITVPAGITTIYYVTSGSPDFWVYEISGKNIALDVDGNNGNADNPPDTTPVGPTLAGSVGGTQTAIFAQDVASRWATSGIAFKDDDGDEFYVTVEAHNDTLNSPPAIVSAINSPWTLDAALNQSLGSPLVQFRSAHLLFAPTPPPPPPPPTPPPCAPVDRTNRLTSGVLIDDLSLFIGPATALYKVPIIPNVINSYETTSEGRHEIVLDFNQGDGLYARDLGTVFSWPLNVVGKATTVLYTWQPAIIAMPEGSYGRATDWMDGGTNGAKFIQGVMIEADSFNNAKTFFLQDSDTLAMHMLNETPATFNKQSEKAFSCTPPFVAHSARIISTDGVEWRVWSSKLVFQPWPEMALNWQTEMTSLGLTGWGHVREINLPYVSTASVTLVLIFDAWPTITLTLPSTAGVQNKTKLTLPPNKFKLMSLRAFSSQGFRLFEKDLELKIKAWGTTEAYTIVRPFGGPSRAGAVV